MSEKIGPASEIGEELTNEQLAEKPFTVVVISASHRPEEFLTAWFLKLESGWATFHMGELKATFLAQARNGKLFDEMNHQIHVYRYLGEV